MGNAFNAVCDDNQTLVYNPAGMSKIPKVNIYWQPLIIGWNDFVGDFLSLAGNEELMQLLKGEKAWGDVNQGTKDDISRKLAPGVSLSLINITAVIPTSGYLGSVGIGFYLNGDMDCNVEIPEVVPNVPNLKMLGILDSVFIVGSSHKINNYYKDLPGTLSVGLSFKSLNRRKIDANLSLDSIGGNLFDDSLRDGTGFGIDIGAVYNLPKKDNLNFALVLADIGSTSIKWDNNTTTKIDGRINLGVSWKPTRIPYWKDKYIDPKENVTLTADLNNIGLGGDFFKNIHLGADYKLKSVALRFGINQGYITFGLKFFSLLELTYFQEESPLQGSGPSKRYYINLSIGF
jgi:hypothetical protein